MDNLSTKELNNEFIKCQYIDVKPTLINPNIEIFRSNCLFKLLSRF